MKKNSKEYLVFGVFIFTCIVPIVFNYPFILKLTNVSAGVFLATRYIKSDPLRNIIQFLCLMVFVYVFIQIYA